MIVSDTKLPSVCLLCFLIMKIFILAIFYCLIEPFFKRYLSKIQFNLKYKGPETAYHTVSIKRPGLEFLQKSLLNVLYDLKNGGLNTLSYRTYKRVMRVRWS